jgi:hypothetical protein
MHHVDTVAMESTGVYWIPAFELLEERGFKVYLVNARNMKAVPGRKGDYQDCQWIQKLHSVGLLTSSFRPDAEITPCVPICVIAPISYSIALHIQQMQKALVQMNIHCHRYSVTSQGDRLGYRAGNGGRRGGMG